MTSVHLFSAGAATVVQAVQTPDNYWSPITMPCNVALIQKKNGKYLLFDTGPINRLQKRRVKKSLENQVSLLFCKTAICDEYKPLSRLLETKGISPSEVEEVFISHTHRDHVGGLIEFAHLPLLCLPQAQAVWKSLLTSIWKDGADLQPNLRPLERKVQLPAEFFPFKEAWQLFEHEEIYAIELPGHAQFHTGLCIHSSQFGQSGWVFLIADASYGAAGYTEGYKMRWPLHQILNTFPLLAAETVEKLHTLYQNSPQIIQIPSHESIGTL